MAQIDELGISNLRRLKELRPRVPISPITILLGKNSVGKSTFARIFPLFRQSAARRKRSPILWFGDLVDFGSIGQAKTFGESDISFDISLKLDNRAGVESSATVDYWGVQGVAVKSAKVHLTLSENESSKEGFASYLRIEVFGGSIEVRLPLPIEPGNSLTINGVQRQLANKDYLLYSHQGVILPYVAFYKNQPVKDSSSIWSPCANPWTDDAAQMIKHWIHGNASTTTARRIASQVPMGTPSEIAEFLPKIRGPQSWNNFVKIPLNCANLAARLHECLLAKHVTAIISQIDIALETYFKGVRYLKPLRAVAERYYRRVELSVAEIDPDGSNLAIFLDSLNYFQLQTFKAWTLENLEIEAYPVRNGDQLTIMAKALGDDREFNIADMGFGISQVLPIAAQLWWTTQENQGSTVVVLEQPELHLHPDFQSRLADLFVSTVKKRKNGPPLIIETHSQQIVNRIGQLVERGELNPADVTILLFESSPENSSHTVVRKSEFNAEGVLMNWPYGFFEPEIR